VPFKSCAQMRAMFAKDPDLAKEWVKKYGVPDDCKKSDKDDSGDSRKNHAKRKMTARMKGKL
jgi:hypothetical protein